MASHGDFVPHDWGHPSRKAFFRRGRGSVVPWWDGSFGEEAAESLREQQASVAPARARYSRIFDSLFAVRSPDPSIRALRDVMMHHFPGRVRGHRTDILYCLTCYHYELPVQWPCDTFLAIERAHDHRDDPDATSHDPDDDDTMEQDVHG